MTETTATLFQTSSRLIHELYHISITALNSPEDILMFVNDHQLNKLQTYITEKVLIQLISEIQAGELLCLTDIFTPQMILFYIEDTPILFGPYCPFILTHRDARTLIGRHKPDHLHEKQLLHYVSSFPHVTESEAIHIVFSMLHLICPENSDRTVRKINDQEVTDTSDDNMYNNRENEIHLLEKRYSYEQRFLKDIIEGNSRSAILNLRNMQMDVAYLKRMGTTMENERIGAAIARTTVRLAALQAKLPPFIVDRLSGENAAITRASRNVEEIIAGKEKMIRDFCRAIRDNRNHQYTALTQSAIYYIEHEYYKNISVQILAKDLEISENHLIAVFRKDTGTTPNIFLRTTRLKQAAILLSGTSLTVQEIANSVGIPDANYFIKCFRKEYEVTPMTYRKKSRI